MSKHMTIEEFDKLRSSNTPNTAVKEYFLSYEDVIVKSNDSARDFRPLKILCDTYGKLDAVVISYFEESVYCDKAKRKYVRIAPEELRELADSLLTIAEANEKLCKHLDTKNN